MSNIKVGDVVYLKRIDGPAMMVSMVIPSGPVQCAWFNTSSELQVKNFDPVLLETAEEVQDRMSEMVRKKTKMISDLTHD